MIINKVWFAWLFILAALQLWKCAEICYDIVWARRAGRSYQRAALKHLRQKGTIPLDDLDKQYARKQPLWQIASQWPKMPRRIVGVVFRVPTLIVLQTALLLLIPSRETLFDQAALIATCATLWFGIAISVLKEFIHRIHLGWFYLYRRDMMFQPAGKHDIADKDIGDDAMLGRLLLLLALIVLVIILGFGSIYYALELAFPKTFDIGNGNKWLGCLYFSAVTMATVGYGDVKPFGDLGRAIVISQIVLGPFVLTMLILALSTAQVTPRVPRGNVDATP